MGMLIGFVILMSFILMHEFGHMVAAKTFGVHVYEFSVGMGPKLTSHACRDGMELSLRCVPIGGFCRFDEPDVAGGEFQDTALQKLSPIKRIIVFASGAMVNIMVAFLIMLVVYTIAGDRKPTNIVSSVIPDSPSYEHILEGDELICVNGIELNDGVDLNSLIQKSNGREITVELKRNGKSVFTKITPESVEDGTGTKYVIGIRREVVRTGMSPMKVISEAASDTWWYVSSIWDVLVQMVHGQVGASEMSSVIGVADTIGEYATPSQWVTFACLLAMVSANLGVVNLLPIPGLDGSKIVSSLYELVTGRRINGKLGMMVTSIGACLILALTAFLMVSDMVRMFQ